MMTFWPTLVGKCIFCYLFFKPWSDGQGNDQKGSKDIFHFIWTLNCLDLMLHTFFDVRKTYGNLDKNKLCEGFVKVIDL